MFDGNEVVFFINVYNQCPDNEIIGYIGNEILSTEQKHEENYKFISTIKYFLAIWRHIIDSTF